MIVYDGLKSDFLRCCEQDDIADYIRNSILTKMGRHTPDNEYRAWENSLNFMYRVLNDPDIPNDAGIAIEYNVPLTAKRVDFMISGYDAYENPSVVIIELKQWQQLFPVEGSDSLVSTVLNGGLRQVVHPSYQAWSYAQLISDYNATVQDTDIKLHPCAYLHNYPRHNPDPLDNDQYKDYYLEAPAYSKGQNDKLRAFIKQFVSKGDQKKLLYEIDCGKIRPSKRLQDAIWSMMDGNQEFIMIDEQRVAFEGILKQINRCYTDGKKRTIVVKGGPGTGKSVIAINLLATLTRQGKVAHYVTKTNAPRDVYKAKLKGYKKKSIIDNMFKGSGCYIGAEANKAGVLIADEAHRLRKKGQYDHGENQIKEIINAALCSVFFIDESQRVTTEDIGSIDEIQHWANFYGCKIKQFELLSQFRCNGSDGYLAWLDDVLQIRETANYCLEGLDYDFRVYDSPAELYEAIKQKNNDQNQARMVAGYCWNWNKREQNNTDFHDIQIGDFAMSWNLGKGVYALEDTSINEIGCIHTTQGLEFDYIGVIIGEDLRYEKGQLITDFKKRAKTDQSIKGIKKMNKQDPAKAKKLADEIIKNTYRTLMSRGIKGCYIYCVDEALQEYFKGRLALRDDLYSWIPDSPEEEPEEDNLVYLPVVGEIAAGHEHFMEEEILDLIGVEPSKLHPNTPGKHFFLKVSGDSMTGVNINDGDAVLIRKMSNPRGDLKDGDIIACMIHGERATLKTYRKHPDGVLLHPENPDYDDLFIPFEEFLIGDAKIIGKMVDICSMT